MAHLLSEMVVQGRAMRVPRGFEAVYARGARGWRYVHYRRADRLDWPEGHQGDVPSHSRSRRHPTWRVLQPLPWQCRHVAEWAELWVDGDRVTRFNIGNDPSDPRMMNDYLENIPASDVQAIEVYTSSVTIPADFDPVGSPCAVIAVWTEAVTVAVSGRRKHRTKRSCAPGAKDI